MKKKLSNWIVLTVLIMAVFLSGCSPTPSATPSASAPMASTPAASTPVASAPSASADLVTTASIVNEENALANALSKNGTWIAAILNDISTKKELVIEGDFHDKNDASAPLYRKLALYAQDENRNVTDRYILTAPKLIVKSPNTKIQGGTFRGDVYVQSNGFTIQDATVDGNVYFASQEYMDSYVLPTEEGKAGKVTGATEVKAQ